MPQYHPTIGDAVGSAMAHNARPAAQLTADRAAEASGDEPEFTAPPIPIDWTDGPYDLVPLAHRPAIERYETAIAGIPDCFDGFDARVLRDTAIDAAERGLVVATHVDALVHTYLGMLDSWYQEIDTLHSEFLNAAGLPEWGRLLLGDISAELQRASRDLHRAVIAFHHGAPGPVVSDAYGGAYALSNGTIYPTPSMNAVVAVSPAARSRDDLAQLVRTFIPHPPEGEADQAVAHALELAAQTVQRGRR